MNTASVLAVIPALNEEAALPGVIRALRGCGLNRIRVADNGSTDRTADVARTAGAEVVSEPRRGYGQACFTACENLPPDIEWILFCDADGSDDLDALRRIFEAAETHDLILANRRATPEGRAALTPAQNFGNALAGLLLRLIYGRRFHDLGPLRMIRRGAYEALGMKDRSFGWTVEMQSRACANRLCIIEIPARYFPRKAGRSKISGTLTGSAKAGWVILATLGALFVERFGKELALLAAALMIGGALLMQPYGAFRQPGAVNGFLVAGAVMSAGYLLGGLLRRPSPWLVLGVAVIARLILLPMTPGTDIWRYIWEGMIQSHGWNPYLYAPEASQLAALRTNWWESINNKEITAIYPPLAQLLFRGMATASGSALLFKTVFAAADIAVCMLLCRRFGARNALLYAWSPIVVYSFAGGGHYDSVVVLCVVAGWLAWEKRQRLSQTNGRDSAGADLAAAFLLGMAAGFKYVAAPLAGFVLWRIFLRVGLKRAALAGVLCVLPFCAAVAAFWIPDGVHPLVPKDFSQYARSAGFLPRLAAVFWETSGWDNARFLFPSLALGTWFHFGTRSLAGMAGQWWLALFAFSPVIHAWYFTWALPLAAHSRNLGWRLLGISALVYFLLEKRAAAGLTWELPWSAWCALWLPPLAGFLIHYRQASAARRASRPHPPGEDREGALL